MTVHHLDREVEFILFKRELQELFENRNFNNKSCEMICDDIAEYLADKYPGRTYTISVSEDGENGAIGKYVFKEKKYENPVHITD